MSKRPLSILVLTLLVALLAACNRSDTPPTATPVPTAAAAKVAPTAAPTQAAPKAVSPTAPAAVAAPTQAAPKAVSPTAVATAAATPAAQAKVTNTPRLRQLDFAPFKDALAGFTSERAAKVDGIVKDKTITDVQAAMQSGALTSEDLTLYFLSRIQRYDDALRTFIELNPNALQEARAADALRKQGKVRGPLHGIPLSIKDNIETAAPMHTTGGAEILLNHVPKADAPLVKQLRDAGAVILGKNNLSELAGGVALNPPGASAVGGLTGNPHGPFSAGGSSSGSGASTAAYLTMASVGSETAGSLIVPASWNGVVGMYPSKGVVTGSGVIPLVKNNDSAGPLGRSVRDVALLLNAMDTKAVDYTAGLDPKALNGVKAGFFKSDVLAHPAAPEENTADNAAIAQLIEKSLTGAGATVADVQVTPSELAKSADRALLGLLLGGIRHDMLPYLKAAGAPVATPEELAAYNLKDAKTRIPFGQFALDTVVTTGALKDAGEFQKAVEETKAAFKASLDAAFASSNADVLVSVNNYHSSLYPTANYPAISVPLGLRANGMPVGVTLIGKPGQEAKLLAYAYALEQATKRRVNPDLTKLASQASALSGAARAATFGPGWQSAPCETLDVAKDIAAIADCGYVTVPENRAKGGDKTIQLGVVRVKSTNPNPGAPIVLGTGGPGSYGLGRAQTAAAGAGWLNSHGDILADRDWVFFTQRGTKGAKPELLCPAVDVLPVQAASEGWNEEKLTAQVTQAVKGCYDAFVAQGVDFSGYNSNENAADVNAIRQALGYDKIIFYGQSYGTLLGQFLMRNHPDAVQAVILDGVVPAKLTQYAQLVDMQAAFRRVFDACKADQACNASFPDLETTLAQVYDAFRANPKPVDITIGTQTIPLKLDGVAVMDSLFSQLYGGGADLPRLIYGLKNNDPVILKSLAPSISPLNPRAHLMQYAINCSDDPNTSLADFDVKGMLPMYAALTRNDAIKTSVAPCQVVRVPHLPDSSDTTVTSDLPVLLLNGSLDPATAAAYGASVAATLPKSQNTIFAGAGHVQGENPCGLSLIKAFANNPSAKLDTACVPTKAKFNLPVPVKITSEDGRASLNMTLPAGFVPSTQPNTWNLGSASISLPKIEPAGTTAEQALLNHIKALPVEVKDPRIVDRPPVDGNPAKAVQATLDFQGLKIALDFIAIQGKAGTFVVSSALPDLALAEGYRQSTLTPVIQSITITPK